MNKKVREHGNTIVESITAADELEKIIKEKEADGTLKPGTRGYNDAKKALKELRASIGLATRRGR
jgi:predicted methyltransferase MtxX (methanogen marker protein 4)